MYGVLQSLKSFHNAIYTWSYRLPNYSKINTLIMKELTKAILLRNWKLKLCIIFSYYVQPTHKKTLKAMSSISGLKVWSLELHKIMYTPCISAIIFWKWPWLQHVQSSYIYTTTMYVPSCKQTGLSTITSLSTGITGHSWKESVEYCAFWHIYTRGWLLYECVCASVGKEMQSFRQHNNSLFVIPFHANYVNKNIAVA